MFHTPAHKVVPVHTVVSSEAGVIGYAVGPQGAQASADYANGVARQRGSKARYHAGYDCPAQLVNDLTATRSA